MGRPRPGGHRYLEPGFGRRADADPDENMSSAGGGSQGSPGLEPSTAMVGVYMATTGTTAGKPYTAEQPTLYVPVAEYPSSQGARPPPPALPRTAPPDQDLQEADRQIAELRAALATRDELERIWNEEYRIARTAQAAQAKLSQEGWDHREVELQERVAQEMERRKVSDQDFAGLQAKVYLLEKERAQEREEDTQFRVEADRRMEEVTQKCGQAVSKATAAIEETKLQAEEELSRIRRKMEHQARESRAREAREVGHQEAQLEELRMYREQAAAGRSRRQPRERASSPRSNGSGWAREWSSEVAANGATTRTQSVPAPSTFQPASSQAYRGTGREPQPYGQGAGSGRFPALPWSAPGDIPKAPSLDRSGVSSTAATWNSSFESADAPAARPGDSQSWGPGGTGAFGFPVTGGYAPGYGVSFRPFIAYDAVEPFDTSLSLDKRRACRLSHNPGTKAWVQQLPESVRRSWKQLSDRFYREFCRSTESPVERYLRLKQEARETPRTFLWRLNAAATKANVDFHSASGCRRHVNQLLKNLRDRELQLSLQGRVYFTTDELEDVLKQVEEMEQ
ncbi:hypothetical protein PHMEG_00033265, partial [Phytophthora megakarya]